MKVGLVVSLQWCFTLQRSTKNTSTGTISKKRAGRKSTRFVVCVYVNVDLLSVKCALTCLRETQFSVVVCVCVNVDVYLSI